MTTIARTLLRRGMFGCVSMNEWKEERSHKTRRVNLKAADFMLRSKEEAVAKHPRCLRILLLASAYNGLTQAVHRRLRSLGHHVSVEFAAQEQVVRDAIASFGPDLIVCPFLKEFVPADIFRAHKVLILHPGIIGDRGPSSIDWAILQGQREWGVVVVEGAEEYDAGAVWASRTFQVPADATKSRMYGDLVSSAALSAIEEAVGHFGTDFVPESVDFSGSWVRGRKLPLMKQADCAIDWEKDGTEAILRNVRARDGQPGLLQRFPAASASAYLYGAHREDGLVGQPFQMLATRNGAVCFGTTDGAVWITHARASKLTRDAARACVPHGDKLYKLPAAVVLGEQLGLPLPKELPVGLDCQVPGSTFQDVAYQKRGNVGFVLFQFYNGAMATEDCRRLQRCLQHAKAQADTQAIVIAGGAVLHGGAGYFSNGIHLNAIDVARDPAQEGWENINAIDDVVLEILDSPQHLTVACVCGNAGAGGAMLPLAADRVVAGERVVFNPHYATMGLYGSEYWTRSLPKRVGNAMADELTTRCLPLNAREAEELGMVDAAVPGPMSAALDRASSDARRMAASAEVLLGKKAQLRKQEEAEKPWHVYREEELREMRANFFDDSLGFAACRRAFVGKERADAAPTRIAGHRR
uniref:Formyl transferase C-terminal domain-containing protein n=1 Tax=Zooxanthella nutricula TaxID=1333877 RepID=A0A7S2P383_9DINO